MSSFRSVALGAVLVALIAAPACRRDPSSTQTQPSDQFGGTGSGYTVQCSGWFPDWISPSPPAAGVESFQLAQGYYLGVPVFGEVDGQTQVVAWNPPGPATNVPWLAFDFHAPAQRLDYLAALRDYLLLGMSAVDFVAQKNTQRRWYHVPMMTTSPSSRREPYHGTTKERPLFASQHSWVVPGNQLDSFAIGYYNFLGSYTLGQVFHDPDPQLADPAKAQFIDGTFVFKLIFAEYDPGKIVAALDPLTGAPEWQVQDVEAPAAALKTVRLLQVDVAVKDPRSAQSGWVFATFVYDKSLASTIADPWRRLTPVGLQWGNDPDVTGPGGGTLDESWTDESALPAVFQGHLGRNGRLNGPVDNPVSSCLSCHSTAQIRAGATPLSAFRAVRLVPPGGCSDAQDMAWFRNIVGPAPFGSMTSNGTGCTLAAPQPATPPLHGLDYSLQLADGLESSLYYGNPNPCQDLALELESAAATRPIGRDSAQRMAAPQLRRIEAAPALIEHLRRKEEPRDRR